MRPVLEVTGLRVTFPGRVRAVRGVGFAVTPREVLAVVGASGSGKSVTALAVMGLLPPSASVAGSVRFRGAELLGRGDRALAAVRGSGIAMVFQDDLSALTPVRRVGDQIAEAVRVHARVPRRAAAGRAVELLARLGVPDPRRRARAYPHELSGGMRRRVMIAMAMAGRPAVIIADEPTTGLDAITRAQVLDVLRTARDETGAALIVITHDAGVAACCADRVLVMAQGRVAEAGPVRDVLSRPRTAYAKALLKVDRPVPARRPPARADPVLQVSGLVRARPAAGGLRRRAVRAVDGVGFEVRAGETLALVGESGCGKTSTLREILRLRAPQAGRIVVFGTDTAGLVRRRRRELRGAVQAVFQDPSASLNPRMRVGAILAEALRAHGHPRDRIPARTGELLCLVGLASGDAARYPGELSGGQRQRVAIARALAVRPRLLLLDEPVSALDAHLRAGLLDLLAGLRERLGLSYLLAGHDLAMVRRIADRVAVMYLGRIVEIGDADRVYAAPGHPYTRALLAAALPPPHRWHAPGPHGPLPDPPPGPCGSPPFPHDLPPGVPPGPYGISPDRQPGPQGPLPGEPPSPYELPSGCRFRTRCPAYGMLGAPERRRCADDEPVLLPAAAGQDVACHHPVVVS